MSLKSSIFSPAGAPARWLVAALAVAALAGCGSPREDGKYLLDDLEELRNLPDADWEALRTELPPVPTMADTLPIESLDQGDRFHYGIDPRSIRIAPGGIVRYSLISRSDRGAQNISFESIRCIAREWRTVALVGSTGKWEQARHADWRPLRLDSVQQLLRNGVFCTGGGPATAKAEGLVERLRYWTRYGDAFLPLSSP